MRLCKSLQRATAAVPNKETPNENKLKNSWRNYITIKVLLRDLAALAVQHTAPE